MKPRKRILVITGVPGTGKTSFSNLLAKRIGDTEVIHATDVVNRKRFFTSYSKDGAKIVQMKRLQNELERMARSSRKSHVIIESHLLCDLKIRGASALVLREHLATLAKRMQDRGYSNGKIKANIVSEATDYCGIRAERNYATVLEAFSGDSKLESYALALISGKKPKAKEIDLLPEFDKLLRHRKEIAL